MGRHTDPVAVTRRATVLTLTASALLVAAGIAIFLSSGGIQWEPQPPPPSAALPPWTGEIPRPEGTSGPTEPPPPTSGPTPSGTGAPPAAAGTGPATSGPATSGPGAGQTPAARTPAIVPATLTPVRVTTNPPVLPADAARAPAPPPGGPKRPKQAGPDTAHLARQAVTLVNVERRKAGCAPLATVAALVQAAQAHSADLAARGRLTHVGSDGSTFVDRIRAAGYPGTMLAESVAAGPWNARAVVRSWIDSPANRAVILDCRLTDIGVGVAASANGTYWTGDLGGAR